MTNQANTHRDDLPLTVPVQSIIVGALDSLREGGHLDRDEAYLLARLERVPDAERTAALLQAIEDAPE